MLVAGKFEARCSSDVPIKAAFVVPAYFRALFDAGDGDSTGLTNLSSGDGGQESSINGEL